MYLISTIRPTTGDVLRQVKRHARVPRSGIVRSLTGRQLTILLLLPESIIVFLISTLLRSLLPQQCLARNLGESGA